MNPRVSLGDDDAAQLLLVLEDIGVVRKHEVDTGLRVVREHEAGVDEHHVLAALEHGHVLTDAVQTAQGNDLERRRLLLSCLSHKASYVLSIDRDQCNGGRAAEPF